MLLTIDLGSTVTKTVLWEQDGPVATGRSVLRTDRRPGGIAEQDPSDWWESVVAACREALSQASGGTVRGISFSAARQTFVCVDPDLRPLSPGIMWSDRRAGAEARDLAAVLGGVEAVRRRTGMVLDSAAPAAKLAWLDRHERRMISKARWILSPRDLVVGRLTGEVCADRTLAQSSGLYDSSLVLVPELVGDHGDLLPPVLDSKSMAGTLLPHVASELGLRAGIPVVVGAGDRPCEVLGTGAARERPMISWGTTANVSVPIDAWPSDWDRTRYRGVVVSRGAAGGFLLEAGLSAAGSFVEWIAGLRGENTDVGELFELAAASPPGAEGVTAVCWLGGARAPWWRDDARAALLGLSPEHTAGDLARAAVESVAFDVARCLEALADAEPASAVAMAGGSGLGLWQRILCGVTGLRATRRLSGLGACAGAALLAREATGFEADLDEIDPPAPDVDPDPVLVGIYEKLRSVSDAATASNLRFTDPGSPAP